MTKASLKENLDTFLLLKQNWDSYGGLPISREVIEKAKEWVEILPGENWVVLPTSTGGVQFESNDGCYIEVCIDKSQ